MLKLDTPDPRTTKVRTNRSGTLTDYVDAGIYEIDGETILGWWSVDGVKRAGQWERESGRPLFLMCGRLENAPATPVTVERFAVLDRHGEICIYARRPTKTEIENSDMRGVKPISISVVPGVFE